MITRNCVLLPFPAIFAIRGMCRSEALKMLVLKHENTKILVDHVRLGNDVYQTSLREINLNFLVSHSGTAIELSMAKCLPMRTLILDFDRANENLRL